MSTITVPVPKIEIGDIIDGRTVRVVSGRQKRSCTASYHTAVSDGHPSSGRRAPSLTFSGHVVCVGFEDDGPWKYIFGQKTVEVQRVVALPGAA